MRKGIIIAKDNQMNKKEKENDPHVRLVKFVFLKFIDYYFTRTRIDLYSSIKLIPYLLLFSLESYVYLFVFLEVMN
jgi:hypothetical protein